MTILYQSRCYNEMCYKGTEMYFCFHHIMGSCAITIKPVLSGHLKEDPKQVFETDNCLMQDKSIAENAPVEHYAVLLTCIQVPQGF